MLKYVNTGVVFQEIPDEVTLSINIANCPCHCPGCHSQYLWDDIGQPLTVACLDKMAKECKNEITCICFMGGDAEPEYVETLAKFIHRQYPEIKVGWYSGRARVPYKINKENFDYIKLGPYIKHLGSLRKPTTNQRIYKKDIKNNFIDITPKFWRENKEI